MTRAHVSSVTKAVHLPARTPRSEVKEPLGRALLDVLDAAVDVDGFTDLRKSIMTAVYNYDTESFEIRWDLAK
jgi:hypothetical protein